MKPILACLLVLLPTLDQEPQRPTFSTSINILTLDVTALDRDGKPVAGLRPEDFEIKINGSVRTVQTVAYIEAKVAGASTAPAAEPLVPAVSVRRSVVNARLPNESRLFVIVVDDLSFQPGSGKALFVSAERFVAKLPASDYVGFVLTSGSASVNPTRDRQSVLTALKRTVGMFSNPANVVDPPTVGISEAFDIDDGSESRERDVILRECLDSKETTAYANRSVVFLRGISQCAGRVTSRAKLIVQQVRATRERQIRSLESIVDSLKGAGGIKNLVLLSGGVAVTKGVDELLPVARAAARAGVQISTMVEEGDIDLSDMGSGGSDGSGSSAPNPGRAKVRRDDDKMLFGGAQTMTDMAGGQFYRVIGQPTRFYERVTVSASSVYRLGVELPSNTKPGQDLSISASVKRSGVSAIASRYASAPEPEVSLPPAEIMAAAVKRGETLYGVPISFGAIVRRGAAPGQIEIGTVITVPGSVDGPLEATIGVLDGAGALKSGKRSVPAVANSDYSITYAIPVQQGPHQIRVAVQDASGKVGAVAMAINATLNVMGDLQTSDLLTWTPDAGGRMRLLVVEDLPSDVKSLTGMLELYAAATLPADLAVRFALLDSSGKSVQDKNANLTPGAGTVRADAQFAVDALTPGKYALRADVSVGGKQIGSVTTPVSKR